MPETRERNDMTRPWFAIGWFLVWSLFQTFAVVSVLNGTWVQPEAFPTGAVYDSLIRPRSSSPSIWRRRCFSGVDTGSEAPWRSWPVAESSTS